MGAYFTAQYDDECAQCGEPIYEGDTAGYVDNEVCCEMCWLDDQDNDEDW